MHIFRKLDYMEVQTTLEIVIHLNFFANDFNFLSIRRIGKVPSVMEVQFP